MQLTTQNNENFYKGAGYYHKKKIKKFKARVISSSNLSEIQSYMK